MRRLSAALVVAGALVVGAPSASGDHGTFSVTLSNPAAGAYSDVTLTWDFGTTEMTSVEVQWPTGWQFAQQTGTSPISPVPLDGHVIGTGVDTATFEPFCSLSQSNQTVTGRWESTIDSTAPANTVAQHNWSTTLLHTHRTYVVRNGVNDYDVETPDYPDDFMCDGKATSGTRTYFGSYTAGGTTYRVLRNPSTPGTYTFTLVGVDAGGTVHTINAGVPVV